MKTAVIYARYSSDNQNEQSIEGQLRVCNDFANRNNIIVIDTYIDRATTGTNDNRIDFQRMMRDSSKKEWNYIICYWWWRKIFFFASTYSCISVCQSR